MPGMKKFAVGDRVKCWFVGRWVRGTVVNIGPASETARRFLFDKYYSPETVEVLAINDQTVIFINPNSRALVKHVLTDERVGNETDLFGGFGLRSRAEDHIYTLFEDEEEPLEPNDFIPATDEELEDLPF